MKQHNHFILTVRHNSCQMHAVKKQRRKTGLSACPLYEHRSETATASVEQFLGVLNELRNQFSYFGVLNFKEHLNIPDNFYCICINQRCSEIFIFEAKHLWRKTKVNLNCISNATTCKAVLQRGKSPSAVWFQRTDVGQCQEHSINIYNTYIES